MSNPREFKRTPSGHLIVADYTTPAADKRYGYKLAPVSTERVSTAAIAERLHADLFGPMTAAQRMNAGDFA